MKQISLNTKGDGSLNVATSTLAAGAYQYSLIVDGKPVDIKQMLLSNKHQKILLLN